MNFKVFLLSIAIFVAAIAEDCYGTSPRPVYKTARVPIWLNAGTGINVPHYFEQGASALPYWGIGADFHSGISLAKKNSYISYQLRGLGNIAFSDALSPKAFDFGIETEAEYLYRFYNTGNWHFWAGGTLPCYIAINYSPLLMNAAIGYSTFFTLNAEGMAQFDFVKYNETHHWFTAYAKLSLPLFGFVERPGFAYIDNYTETLINTETETVTKDSFMMLVPGISTDIGLFVNLLNNNKIGISYRWHYLTTRHQGSYRFDHANHSINVTYMFNLN